MLKMSVIQCADAFLHYVMQIPIDRTDAHVNDAQSTGRSSIIVGGSCANQLGLRELEAYLAKA